MGRKGVGQNRAERTTDDSTEPIWNKLQFQKPVQCGYSPVRIPHTCTILYYSTVILSVREQNLIVIHDIYISIYIDISSSGRLNMILVHRNPVLIYRLYGKVSKVQFKHVQLCSTSASKIGKYTRL